MSKLSRRKVLAGGGQAVAAAAVLPFIPTVAYAKEDAELFALYEKRKQLETEYMAATNRYDETCRAVSRRFAGLPPYEPPTKPLTLETPEHKAFIAKAQYDSALIDAAEEQRPGVLAEAKKQAGVPALEKKKDAAERAWLDAEDRIFAARASTAQGMLLKLTIDWTDRMRRDWPAKGLAAGVAFYDGATASVVTDLERLIARAS